MKIRIVHTTNTQTMQENVYFTEEFDLDAKDFIIPGGEWVITFDNVVDIDPLPPLFPLERELIVR